MTGFNAHWLTLREPADRRARNEALLVAAAAAADASAGTLMDIGCGTGATYRALSPRLGRAARWIFFDADEVLLAEARRRHQVHEVAFLRGDLRMVEGLPLSGVTLVTASALFDLCSEQFILAFVRRLADSRIGIYAALNYDGAIEWSQVHALDQTIPRIFNAHQARDKGFGPALGPAAWRLMGECLEEEGFQVETAASPWLLTAADAELQRPFIKGLANAVSEQGGVTQPDLDAWSSFRLANIEVAGSSCRVGHQDVLALP